MVIRPLEENKMGVFQPIQLQLSSDFFLLPLTDQSPHMVAPCIPSRVLVIFGERDGGVSLHPPEGNSTGVKL